MTILFQRISDVCAAQHDDTMLLLNIATGKYHGLNPVATRIWELLDQPVNEESLVSILLQEFAVEPDHCHREVSKFLNLLRERCLLLP